MTTSNGRRTNAASQATGDCLVVAVKESRKSEMRALGYLYAMYKLPGQDTATRGFAFKKNCVLDIDNGFAFDERSTLVFDEHLRSSRVRDEFYPPKLEVPAESAAELQSEGIYPDLDRVQDLPQLQRQAAPGRVVPRIDMSVDQLMEYLTPEDQADLKRQLAYTIAAAKCMGVTQAAMWQQATSLAGVHFIPAFDPRYKESLR